MALEQQCCLHELRNALIVDEIGNERLAVIDYVQVLLPPLGGGRMKVLVRQSTLVIDALIFVLEIYRSLFSYRNSILVTFGL